MTAPVKPDLSSPFSAFDARLASQPLSDRLRGGIEAGITGKFGGRPVTERPAPDDASEFAGMGPWLEDDDQQVFKTLHNLVKRQEILANNRWNQDLYYTTLKLGYTWGTLEKATDQDTYTFRMPYGVTSISSQPIPNKMWDLVNKATETLLVDFPQLDAKGINNSEEAEGAAEFANRFLTIDGGELGTNDNKTFTQAVDRALVASSTFVQVFNDPSGNGWVPLQIKAHPLAVSPDDPLVGPDGTKTTDCVLRYVTADGQFTNDPSQAARQWLPKLRTRVLGREHVRVFPETVTAQEADKVIVLYYCTLAEAKRWWPAVAEMSDAQVEALTDWTPTYYLRLLPASLRARWRISSGDNTEKAGDGDERYMFFYEAYARSTPEHPKGAHVVVSGAQNGIVLHRETWHVDVEQQPVEGTETVVEPKQLSIPVIQITPRVDSDERDATGRPYVEIIEGSVRFRAHLYQSFGDATDKNLHPAWFAPSTSPIQGWQIQDSRSTENIIPVIRPEDYPKKEDPIVLPGNVEGIMDRTEDDINSAASLNKPAQADDKAKEVSGVALKTAIQQSMIGLNRMLRAVNDAIAAYGRVKLQCAQKYFTVPQQLRYVGEDGQQKQVEYSAVDFSLIGDVVVKQGTGTMMPPDQRLNFIGTQLQLGLITLDDASEAAKADYNKFISQDDNVHAQYIERCIGAWLEGPPEGWDVQYQQYQMALQAFQQQASQVLEQYRADSQATIAQGGMPGPMPQVGQPPAPPWSPFAPRPNDAEPEVAMLWKRRLSKLISSVKFEQMQQMYPGWTQMLVDKYMAATQAAQPPMPMPQQSAGKNPGPSQPQSLQAAA